MYEYLTDLHVNATLSSKLLSISSGIQTERLTVYETVADDSLANNLQTFTSQQVLDKIVNCGLVVFTGLYFWCQKRCQEF